VRWRAGRLETTIAQILNGGSRGFLASSVGDGDHADNGRISADMAVG